MSDRKSVLKADPTDWLLGEGNPSVRYLALADILGVPVDDPEAREAKDSVMETGVVPQILAKQEEGGYWEKPDKLYTAKYKGTVWQLIILAELLADGSDERIKNACEFILENSQDRASGGFSQHRSARMGGGRHSEVMPCLTGNIVWSLIRFGYLSDPRVQRVKSQTSCKRRDVSHAARSRALARAVSCSSCVSSPSLPRRRLSC